MKHCLSLALITLIQVFSPFALLSQISLLQSFTYSGIYTQLETEGYKFYLMDVPAAECRIYQTNHSLWKTVKLNVPANQWLTDIQYVSQHLFNSDDKVEMLYVYYQYVETANSYYYVYTTRIAGENGQVLLDVPGGAFSEINKVGPDESRLLVYVWDYSVFPYTVETRIYTLPGMLMGKEPETMDPSLEGDPPAYPNPASGRMNIPFPEQMKQNKADLVILDQSGQVVFRQPVNGPVTNVDLTPTGLPGGVYFYKLESPFYQTKPAKIVYIR